MRYAVQRAASARRGRCTRCGSARPGHLRRRLPSADSDESMCIAGLARPEPDRCRDFGAVACRLPDAVDVDGGQELQVPNQFGDVDPGPAVDLRRIFPASSLPRAALDASRYDDATLGESSQVRGREFIRAGQAIRKMSPFRIWRDRLGGISQPHVLGIVLAGGEGKRLFPLTPIAPSLLSRSAVRLPPDRFRSEQPGQCRVLASVCAHAVQVPFTRPPHLADVAVVRLQLVNTSRRCRRSSVSGRAGTPAAPTRSSSR